MFFIQLLRFSSVSDVHNRALIELINSANEYQLKYNLESITRTITITSTSTSTSTSTRLSDE